MKLIDKAMGMFKRLNCKHEYKLIDTEFASRKAGIFIDIYKVEIYKCQHCGKKKKNYLFMW